MQRVLGKAGGQTTVYASNAAGDIIWNAERTVTQTGVTPPLGWRCTGNSPASASDKVPIGFIALPMLRRPRP